MFPSNLPFSPLQHQLPDLLPPASALLALVRDTGATSTARTFYRAPAACTSCPYSPVLKAGGHLR